jgi:hypothetical protein
LQLPELERRTGGEASSSRTLAEVEREHIVATLQATNWVLGGWNGAAARLSRTTLISRMQRLGIVARAAGADGPAPFSIRGGAPHQALRPNRKSRGEESYAGRVVRIDDRL